MRPTILQQLEHGKILCGKVFNSFVETWNYITNRVENLRGDADINNARGFITVDNTDEEHPVIRMTNLESLGKIGDADSQDQIIQGGGEEESKQVLSSVFTNSIHDPNGKVFQLYNFGEEIRESLSSVLSAGAKTDVLLRTFGREEETEMKEGVSCVNRSDTYTLCYLPLSDLIGEKLSTDSQLSSQMTEQSSMYCMSIDKKMLSTEISSSLSGQTLTSYIPYVTLHEFDANKRKKPYKQMSADVLIRNYSSGSDNESSSEGCMLDYVALSDIMTDSVKTDVELADKMQEEKGHEINSIDKKTLVYQSEEQEGQNISVEYVSLHNFEQPIINTFTYPYNSEYGDEEPSFLMRSVGDDSSVNLQYCHLSVDVSKLSSEICAVVSVFISTEISVQLSTQLSTVLSTILSTAIISSVAESMASLSGDSEILDAYANSIQTVAYGNGKYIQLYDFQNGQTLDTIVINNQSKTLPEGMTMLVKDNSDGIPTLRYAELSVDLSASGQSVSVDSQYPDLTKSIAIYPDSNGNQYMSLYDFPCNGTTGEDIVIDNSNRGTADGIHLLIKDTTSGQNTLKYARLSVTLSGEICDSEITNGKSLWHQDADGTRYLELYRFQTDAERSLKTNIGEITSDYYDGEIVAMPCEVAGGGNATFLTKEKEDYKYELKYSELSVTLPKLPLGDKEKGATNSIELVKDSSPYYMLYMFDDDSDIKQFKNTITTTEQNKFYEGEKLGITIKNQSNNDVNLLNRNGSDLEYGKLSIQLPRLPLGDVEEMSSQKSIHLNKNEDCYELHGIGDSHQNESTVNLNWGAETSLIGSSNNFIIRNNSQVNYYGNIKLKMPEKPADYGDDITNLYGQIENHETYINNLCAAYYELTADIDGLDDRLCAIEGSYVKQIIAGKNIQISPASGTGVVTISATGGGVSGDYWQTGGSTDSCNAVDAEITNLTVDTGFVAGSIGGPDATFVFNSGALTSLAVTQSITCDGPVNANGIICPTGRIDDLTCTNITTETIEGLSELEVDSITCDTLQANELTSDGIRVESLLDANELDVATDITVGGGIRAESTIVTSGIIESTGVMITEDGELTIGGTTINETQLQQLLALIQNQ